MKKTKVFYLIAFIVLCGIVHADVTIEITNVSTKTMKVTYLYINDVSGLTEYIYPSNGFIFVKDNFKVLSVIEKNTDQDMEFEILEANNGPALKVKFASPIPKGGNYKIEICVEASTDDIKIEKDNHYSFSYSTGHNMFFVLPEAHAIVYSNYPVIVYEKRGKTVVQISNQDSEIRD